MKARERFNKILLASCDRIQDEVAALIGKPFKLGEARFQAISKEQLFADASGRQVLAHVRVDGELEGKACLLANIKDAIRIGGTLIMLPESELAGVVAEQGYSEELRDSYGEVANIICGATTVTFEEQYPKNVRLVRTEQEVVQPAKVAVESDQPIADIPYYLMSVPMEVDGHTLGELRLVLPAEIFGLAEGAAKGQPAAKAAESQATADAAAKMPAAEEAAVGVLKPETQGQEAEAAVPPLARPQAEETSAEPAAPPQRDLAKQKKLVDSLLVRGLAKMSEEASALLGGALKVEPTGHRALTKEGFLDQAGGKQIMTRLDIRGSGQGEAYMFVPVKTAVHLGGSLIMLPDKELEETVRNEDFSDDARDAYGEVTNIIAGAFSAIFEEQSRLKLGFVKTAIEPVTPGKVDPESDEVFVNQAYYLTQGQISYNEKDLGQLQLLIPARVLELEQLLQAEGEEAPEAAGGEGRADLSREKGSVAEPARLRATATVSADILLFTDDDPEAERIGSVLEEMGYATRILHFKDPVNSVLNARTRLVFLVMREVSEQGFGVAIKISSGGLPVPLVAAGPAWTRTLVLKAVKYGARDILITPAADDDVREKIELNLVKKAA